MRHAVVLAGALALTIPAAAAADEATVAARSAAFMDAFNSGDGAGVGAIYAEDGALLVNDGETIEGREAIAAFWQGFIDGPGGSVELATDEVIDASPEVMLERARFRLFDDDGALMDEGKYVIVWSLVDGEWLMRWDIWNSNAPMAEDAPAEE